MKISSRNFCYGMWLVGWLFIILGSGFKFYESILVPLGMGIWLILFCLAIFHLCVRRKSFHSVLTEIIPFPDDGKVRKTLALKNWRDPSSHAIKQTEIQAIWGESGGVPGYMWFAIGNIHRTNETQTSKIAAQFFKNCEPSFGDIELHGSDMVPGVGLRIRNADTLALEVEIDGEKYPMYQAGYGYGPYIRFCADPPVRKY